MEVKSPMLTNDINIVVHHLIQNRKTEIEGAIESFVKNFLNEKTKEYSEQEKYVFFNAWEEKLISHLSQEGYLKIKRLFLATFPSLEKLREIYSYEYDDTVSKSGEYQNLTPSIPEDYHTFLTKASKLINQAVSSLSNEAETFFNTPVKK